MVTLRGVVLDASFRPVHEARVAVARSSVMVQGLAYGTDENGRFTLALPDGDFTIAAHGGHGASGSLDVRVRDGVADRDLVVVVKGRESDDPARPFEPRMVYYRGQDVAEFLLEDGARFQEEVTPWVTLVRSMDDHRRVIGFRIRNPKLWAQCIADEP